MNASAVAAAHDEADLLSRITACHDEIAGEHDRRLADLRAQEARGEADVRRLESGGEKLLRGLLRGRQEKLDGALAALTALRGQIRRAQQAWRDATRFPVPGLDPEACPCIRDELARCCAAAGDTTPDAELLRWWLAHARPSGEELIRIGRLLQARELRLLFAQIATRRWYVQPKPQKRFDEAMVALGEDAVDAIAPQLADPNAAPGFAAGLIRLLGLLWERAGSDRAVDLVAAHHAAIVFSPPRDQADWPWPTEAAWPPVDGVDALLASFPEAVRHAPGDFGRCTAVAALGLCAGRSPAHRVAIAAALRALAEAPDLAAPVHDRLARTLRDLPAA